MRIDAASLIAPKPELLELVKDLAVGEIIKGRIIESLEDSVSVRTGSGLIFTAALQKGVELQKGAFVELVVKDIYDGKIYAEIKQDSIPTDFDAKVGQVLKESGFPVNEKTMQAVKMLFNYNLPLNKESISDIVSLQSNISSLNRNEEGKVGLLFSGLDIKNTAVEVLNKAALLAEPEIAKILKQSEVVQTADKEAVAGEVPEDNSLGESAGNSSRDAAGINSRETVLLQSEKNSPIRPEVKAEIQESNFPQTEEKSSRILRMLDRLGVKAEGKVKEFVLHAEKLLHELGSTDPEALAFLMSKEMEITPGNIALLFKHKNNKDKISEFLDKLQKQLDGNDNPELKDIRESIRKVFLEPALIKDKEEVREQYRQLIKLVDRLEKFLNHNNINSADIRDTLSNLSDNIDFIKHINQFTNYLQFPLLMNGNAGNAKLYVFKEGKRGTKIDPKNATVLLSLDLKNTGHLECLIAVQGKSIGITFRTEDLETGEIIRGQIDELRSSLEAKGYSLNRAKVINLEEPFNLLKLEAMTNEYNRDRMHFDERI